MPNLQAGEFSSPKNDFEEPPFLQTSFHHVVAEFEAAARFVGLSEDVIQALEQPRLSVRLNIPVRMDDGKLRTFTGYHSIHSLIKGPAIGGIRYREGIDQRSVDAFAFWSTHRCALLQIPFGGSSSAVDCNPKEFSGGELERITRSFVNAASSFIGPDYDVLTSNLGTNQQVMCWIMDTYSHNIKRHSPAVVLGKPVGLGGIAMASHPVALGVDFCIRQAAEKMGFSIEGARVALQGFGAVGASVAKLLAKAGAKIVAVSDVSGVYFNERGIDIQKLVWHKDSYGMLYGAEADLEVQKMDDPFGIFEIPVEILIPGALEDQITKENVGKIQAKVVAEVAFDPVSPDADRELFERGIFVIPDILCNSGGVSGYYLEWVQNRMGYYWDMDRTTREIHRLVRRAFEECVKMKEDKKIPLRLAASVCAVKRIALAGAMRGSHV